MKALAKKYNHKEAEKRWQEKWLADKVYAWDSAVPRDDMFVIDTPPPTVSGLLHMGHIFSYTQADFIARFMRMKGKSVFYPMGFDDNGLPTERLVEKVRKIRASDLPREEFINICKEVVKDAEDDFRHLFRSTALSVDWDQEYQTISEESRKISQMSFLDLFHKEKAYRKLQPMLWDPVDQTAIAQAEIEDKELESREIYMTFGLDDGSGKRVDEFSVMTTRPELLPACVAVMCDPKDAGNYEGKQAICPISAMRVPIIPDEKVDASKGTGMVMCCTFGDETDIYWYEKYRNDYALPLRIILNKYGKIDADLLDKALGENPNKKKVIDLLAGLTAKKAREEVLIKALEKDGSYEKSENITHTVKCAERSGAALEILPTTQWFIKITDQKEELKAKAAECNWNPAYMKVRIDQWIDGLNWDWCISRQRYFGVPFPVWYIQKAEVRDQGSGIGEVEIIVARPEDLPVNPLADLPYGYEEIERLDDGRIKARKTDGGGEFIITPEADVMDTWATSSVSPQLSSKGINRFIKSPPACGGRFGGGQFTTRNRNTQKKAKELRGNPTEAEKKLWQIISRKQIKNFRFRRQHPIGPYIVDFACPENGIIIELDGGQHAENKEYDVVRTKFLEEGGYKVLRFWNNEVLENIEGVYQKIVEYIESLPPSNSPRKQGEDKAEYGRHDDEEIGYVLDHERHAKLFPADLRPQAHEIIRTWAFYTIVKAHLHENSIPWKNLMISGWCLASDKTKMSKSKGNVITPVELIEEKGADAVRFWASTSKLGTDTAFSEDVLKIGNKLVNKLWNATKFASLHMEKLEKAPANAAEDIKNGVISEPLDKWIIARLNRAIAKAEEEFTRFEYSNARAAVEDFFWNDFCDNYLEMVKTRAYGENNVNPKQQLSAIHAIYHSVEAFLRLFAPFVPHITEELYSHLFEDRFAKAGSIHARGTWPDAALYPVDEAAEKTGIAARQVLDAVRKAKAEKNVSIKWPLTNIAISGKDAEQLASAVPDLQNVTNAAKIEFSEAEGEVTVSSEDGRFTVAVDFADESDAA